MPTALALSPHLDDAAFSCGGTLATLAASGWRVVMATIFTESVANPTGFALDCQRDKGLDDAVDYMRMRRAEDEAAALRLGVSVRHMPFREAPHRGYGSAAELFAATRPDDGIGEDLVPALAALIDDAAPDLILAPQAIGGHVDHLQVVAAFHRTPQVRPVLWWRDFPYTVRHAMPKAPLAASFAGLPVREIVLGPAAQEAKAEACAAYATQLGFQFGGRPGLMERLGAEGGRERVSVAGILPEGFPAFDAIA